MEHYILLKARGDSVRVVCVTCGDKEISEKKVIGLSDILQIKVKHHAWVASQKA